MYINLNVIVSGPDTIETHDPAVHVPPDLRWRVGGPFIILAREDMVGGGVSLAFNNAPDDAIAAIDKLAAALSETRKAYVARRDALLAQREESALIDRATDGDR